MNKNLILILAVFLCVGTQAFAAPVFGEIIKNPDGSVHKVSLADAPFYCAGPDKHLPTAREFAEFAQSQGAKGIRETAFAGAPLWQVSSEIAQNEKEGFYPIYETVVGQGTTVDFYFNETDYKKPPGDFGQNWFWSSSRGSPETYDRGDNMSYGFSVGFGIVYYTDGYSYGAVVCARGHK